MRAAYYGSGPLDGAGQSVGLFEYAGYEISDVNTYFKNLGQTRTVPVRGVSLNGAHLGCPPGSCDDSEQALDIEMAISMAPGLKDVVVYVGNSDVSIFNQMAVDNASKQLSCSWGWLRRGKPYSWPLATMDPRLPATWCGRRMIPTLLLWGEQTWSQLARAA